MRLVRISGTLATIEGVAFSRRCQHCGAQMERPVSDCCFTGGGGDENAQANKRPCLDAHMAAKSQDKEVRFALGECANGALQVVLVLCCVRTLCSESVGAE